MTQRFTENIPVFSVNLCVSSVISVSASDNSNAPRRELSGLTRLVAPACQVWMSAGTMISTARGRNSSRDGVRPPSSPSNLISCCGVA